MALKGVWLCAALLMLILMMILLSREESDARHHYVDERDERRCRLHCASKESKLSGAAMLSKEEYEAHRLFYDKAFREYREVEGRDPPRGFDVWLRYARERRCLTSVRNYSRIMEDLRRFRRADAPNEPVFTDSSIRAVWSTPMATQKRLCRLDRYGVRCGGANSLDWIVQWLWREDWPWDFGHLFPRPIEFVWSIMDEPTSLPIEGSDDTYAAPPFTDMDDVYRRATCMQKRYPRDVAPGSVCGFLHSPVTFTPYPRAIPIFSMTKLSCFADIVLPHKYNLEALAQQGDPIPWEQKSTTLFWRGASTGGSPRSARDWEHMARFVFLKWAAGRYDSHRVDAAFSKLVHCGGVACEDIVRAGYPVGGHVGLRGQLGAKYTPAIEGNTFLGRMLRLLSTHQLVFYAGGPFIEWYSERLQPWLHYVPIQGDFSNLHERIQWAVANDGEAQAITRRANHLVQTHLRKEDMNCYAALAMLEYASLVAL